MIAETALIEIDFQRWICTLAHRDVIGPAVAVRRSARAAGHRVVCTRYLGPVPEEHAGSAGNASDFCTDMTPGRDDVVLAKYGRDIFDNPDLQANLNLTNVETLVFIGLLTEHGVALAVRSALAAGYHTWVVAAACAGVSERSHTSALADLSACGATVVATYAEYAQSL